MELIMQNFSFIRTILKSFASTYLQEFKKDTITQVYNMTSDLASNLSTNKCWMILTGPHHIKLATNSAGTAATESISSLNI